MTIGTGQATGTIVNDDLPTLSINNVSTTEENSGDQRRDIHGDVVGDVPAGGDRELCHRQCHAAAGADYTTTSGTLTFPATDVANDHRTRARRHARRGRRDVFGRPVRAR